MIKIPNDDTLIEGEKREIVEIISGEKQNADEVEWM